MIHPVPKPVRREKKPRKPIKRVNAKRRKANQARAYGGQDRVLFVKSLPCVFGKPWGECAGEIHNHHIMNGGMRRKADAKAIVPVCTHHHAELHQMGATGMQYKHQVDLTVAAAHTEIRWQIARGLRTDTQIEHRRPSVGGKA